MLIRLSTLPSNIRVVVLSIFFTHLYCSSFFQNYELVQIGKSQLCIHQRSWLFYFSWLLPAPRGMVALPKVSEGNSTLSNCPGKQRHCRMIRLPKKRTRYSGLYGSGSTSASTKSCSYCTADINNEFSIRYVVGNHYSINFHQ